MARRAQARAPARPLAAALHAAAPLAHRAAPKPSDARPASVCGAGRLMCVRGRCFASARMQALRCPCLRARRAPPPSGRSVTRAPPGRAGALRLAGRPGPRAPGGRAVRRVHVHGRDRAVRAGAPAGPRARPGAADARPRRARQRVQLQRAAQRVRQVRAAGRRPGGLGRDGAQRRAPQRAPARPARPPGPPPQPPPLPRPLSTCLARTRRRYGAGCAAASARSGPGPKAAAREGRAWAPL